MPRLSRAASQARTRAQLIETARELFLRDGYFATSLDKVADAAGYGSTFAVCAVVCAVPVFAVLAAPETLQHQVDVSTPAVEDAARDAAT